jgi:hypothetical protein
MGRVRGDIYSLSTLRGLFEVVNGLKMKSMVRWMRFSRDPKESAITLAYSSRLKQEIGF